MQLPFTTEEFLNIFKSYNQAVFPLQILFITAALFCIYILFKDYKIKNKIINGVLSFLWLWIGIVYQVLFFSSINKAAYFFGIIFIIQSLLFLYYGVVKEELQYNFKKSFSNYLGMLFLIYALVIYPVLGHMLGHQYPYSPTFGLPCPTTIFTFGMLLFINKKIKVTLIILPLIWSLIGFMAALKLSVYEDIGLLIAGLLGFTLLLINNKKESESIKTA